MYLYTVANRWIRDFTQQELERDVVEFVYKTLIIAIRKIKKH